MSGVRDWAAEEVETAQREQGRGLSAGLGLGFRGFGLDGFWGFPSFFQNYFLFPITSKQWFEFKYKFEFEPHSNI